MAITGDQSFLKNINRMALIRLIRGEPGLSRADLSEVTGLTKSTVSQLVQELIDEGWLTEDEALATGSIGRRPTPLRLDTERLALLGVDVTVNAIEVVATNLTGEIIVSRVRKLSTRDLNSVVAEVVALIAEVVTEVSALGRRPLGVGVGVPGPVHANSGVLHYSPNFGWKDVPMREVLRKALVAHGLHDLPIFVQRRAGIAALGEVEFSCDDVDEPLLFIHLGSNIGAGVFISGRLLSGHGGFAGDVGNQQLVLNGRTASANASIGMAAMAGRLGVSEEVFFTRVQAGEPEATAVAREGAQFLAVLIHNLWATFDPAHIVLGGVVARMLTPGWLEEVESELKNQVQGSLIKPPPVTVARFGLQAVAVGATALVLHQYVRPV
ncbi:MAG: ROK family transcriptional regulator [Rhodocyclaceae bacterium]